MEFEDKEGHRGPTAPVGPDLALGCFVLGRHWERVRDALGVRLSELARLRPGRASVVTPLFGPCVGEGGGADIYVVMPFADAMRPLYAEHIRPIAKRLGLTCVRGDDQFTTHAVMQDIWRGLTSARLIIADCTGRNPNVFYEIGVAHAVGKPVLLLAQDPADVPFDVRHIRFLQYEASPEGLRDLDAKLEWTIRSQL